MTETAVASAVDHWIASFEHALTAGDSAAAAELFAGDSYCRDLVAFTWSIKTVEGPAGVKEMLDATLANVRPRGWHAIEPPAEADGVTDAWLEFETEAGRGRAHLRLRDGKAWTLLTTLYELKGHEEPAGRGRSKGVVHGADPDRLSWLERREKEAAELGYETQPYAYLALQLKARMRCRPRSPRCSSTPRSTGRRSWCSTSNWRSARSPERALSLGGSEAERRFLERRRSALSQEPRAQVSATRPTLGK